MKKIPKPAVFALMGCLFAALPGAAQAPPDDLEALKKTAPRIFIDCGSCDLEYIKDEIPFVNYVRDRKEADVHVLITTQTTASEGKEYTLTFMGRDGFSGIDDSIRYYSKKDDTEDDVRKGLVRTLKQGLAAYVVRTPIASRLQVRYSPENGPAAGPDRWNHWLFNISVDGYLEGEESASKGSIGLNATASRVTEEWKLRLGFSSSFRRDSFVYQGTKIESSQESYGASGLLVKSLGPHWSAGLALDADSSSGNIAFPSFRPRRSNTTCFPMPNPRAASFVFFTASGSRMSATGNRRSTTRPGTAFGENRYPSPSTSRKSGASFPAPSAGPIIFTISRRTI